MAEQREDSLEPFVLVDAGSDREELNSLLYRRYADADGIARGRSGLSDIAFAEADADGNNFLDATEAAALLRPRPAVEIAVNLARGQVRIGRISRGGDRVGELPVESPRRTALRLGSEAVEFS